LTDQDRIADAAMATLERHGVPVVRAEMPGLYQQAFGPELTFNQLIGLACQRDAAFNPALFRRSNSPEKP
jgi:hypothetical protein